METVITQIIAKELSIPEKLVVADARIMGELTVDSLYIVCLILGLEETFNIDISDAEAATLKTVKDIFTMVAAKCHPSHPLYKKRDDRMPVTMTTNVPQHFCRVRPSISQKPSNHQLCHGSRDR